jgi:hypothetical protein
MFTVKKPHMARVSIQFKFAISGFFISKYEYLMKVVKSNENGFIVVRHKEIPLPGNDGGDFGFEVT